MVASFAYAAFFTAPAGCSASAYTCLVETESLFLAHELKTTVPEKIIKKDRKIVTLCHGPAALLAGSIDENKFLFDGYEMTVFPDSLDEGANQEIGYMPGKLKWLLAERLEKLGVKIINIGITGEVCKDRNVLTGDSPLAANNLGILTADELLAMVE